MLAGPPDYKAYPFYSSREAPARFRGHLCGCFLNPFDYFGRRSIFCFSDWASMPAESEQEAELKRDALYVRAVNAARSARFEHGENKEPAGGSSCVDYDDKSAECEDCGRSIKARFTRCYKCNRAYEAY